MYCKDCPKVHPAVARPDVACQANCGMLIKWYNKFCAHCSTKLNKCEECGKKTK